MTRWKPLMGGRGSRGGLPVLRRARAIAVGAGIALLWTAPVWLAIGAALWSDTPRAAGELSRAGSTGWRRLLPSATTVGLGTLIAVLAGALMARAYQKARGIGRAALGGAALAVLFLPAFVLAEGVVRLSTALGFPALFVPVFAPGASAVPSAGAWGVVLVTALSGWPIAMLALAWSFGRERASVAAVERTLALPRGIRVRLALARHLPLGLAAGLLIFWRGLLDSATPQLLGFSAYATEIWFAVSRADPAGAVALAGPPMGALAVVLLLGAWRWGRAERWLIDAGTPRGDHEVTRSRARALALAGAVVGLSLVAPIVGLALGPHAPVPWPEVLRLGVPKLWTSLWLGSTVALLATVFGAGAAIWAERRAPGARWLLLLCGLVAFAWPPHLGARGVLATNAWLPDGLGAAGRWRLDALRLVTTLALTHAIVPYALVRQALSRRRRSARQVALLLALPWRTRLRLWGPPVTRAAVAAAVLVALAAMGAREAEQLLAPVPFSSLTPALFQMLHYGATSRTLGLALLEVAFMLAAGLVALLALAALVPRRRAAPEESA